MMSISQVITFGLITLWAGILKVMYGITLVLVYPLWLGWGR